MPKRSYKKKKKPNKFPAMKKKENLMLGQNNDRRCGTVPAGAVLCSADSPYFSRIVITFDS